MGSRTEACSARFMCWDVGFILWRFVTRADLDVATRRLGLTMHLYFDDALESARPLVFAGGSL